MNLFASNLLAYLSQVSTPPSSLLQELERETHLKTLYPRMLSGHIQGRFLSFLSKLIRPQAVLEIGTFTGYSCICLAEGLAANGKIITVDMNEELKFIVEPYLQKAGIREKVELKYGKALEVLKEVEGDFDLIFIDADKQNYLTYYQITLPMLKPGGLLLADNVLWSGKVWDDQARDKETLGIRSFNEYVMADERVENLLMPLRDGMMLVRKV